MQKNYNSKLDYIRKLSNVKSEIFSEITDSIIKNDIEINIRPEEGRLIQLLIKISNSKKIIELGTHAGYSAIFMAESLSGDGEIYTIEHDEKRFLLAKSNFEKYSGKQKIISLKGKAKDILPTLDDQAPFDMIFIDADKPSYNHYLDWAENNIKKGGLIIADDIFLSEAVYSTKIKKNIKESTKNLMVKFNERLSDSEKYQSVIIPNERGLSISMKLF